MRGRQRISADFNLLAAAVNLARMATLGSSARTGLAFAFRTRG